MLLEFIVFLTISYIHFFFVFVIFVFIIFIIINIENFSNCEMSRKKVFRSKSLHSDQEGRDMCEGKIFSLFYHISFIAIILITSLS